MQIMKKLLSAAAALCAAAIIPLAGCGQKVPARPDDFTLDFWITDDVSSADFSGYKYESGWFGASAYYTPDSELNDLGDGTYGPAGAYVRYIITAWPDYSDGGEYITTIEIADPDVSLYGITCNSTAARFEEVMTEQGYNIVTERAADGREWSESWTVAEYGAVSVALCNDGILRVMALVTNKDGIDF